MTLPCSLLCVLYLPLADNRREIESWEFRLRAAADEARERTQEKEGMTQLQERLKQYVFLIDNLTYCEVAVDFYGSTQNNR